MPPERLCDVAEVRPRLNSSISAPFGFPRRDSIAGQAVYSTASLFNGQSIQRPVNQSKKDTSFNVDIPTCLPDVRCTRPSIHTGPANDMVAAPGA